ncbi:MAG: hypothetical protein DMG57_35745 [Acidobacteria bacterium]|nr:MAG: hypothetical protein DMG57_35745 [Acidobacteriota bacterium]
MTATQVSISGHHGEIKINPIEIARPRCAPKALRGIIPAQRRDTMRYAKLAFALLGLAALLIAAEPVVSKNSIALKTQVFAGLLV